MDVRVDDGPPVWTFHARGTRGSPLFSTDHGTWAPGEIFNPHGHAEIINLIDANGNYVARLPPMPDWTNGPDSFAGTLLGGSFMSYVSGSFDVHVVGALQPHRYRIRECTGLALGGVVQVDTIIFEIEDLGSKARLSRHYTFIAPGVSTPAPKHMSFSKNVSSIDLPGPWTEFEAPGFLGLDDFGGRAILLTPLNFGLGTDQSYCYLSFVSRDDGCAGSFWVQMLALNTGPTFAGFPSASGFEGIMMVGPVRAPVTRGKAF
jgi:hypothetical protein